MQPQTAAPELFVPTWPGGPLLCGFRSDLEKHLPISLIRTHTKTDDVPHVTDEQLMLYRQTAFEVAEKYTSMLLTEVRVITENVAIKPPRRHRPYYKHRLRYQTADGRAYLYGGGAANVALEVEPGKREIRVPVMHNAIDASSCCNPCSDGRGINFGMKVTYRAGFDCTRGQGLPAGILVGILKFIAWMVQNPGDEILTVRNREAGESTGIIGTNNGAWASGAIEQWRIYVDDAI